VGPNGRLQQIAANRFSTPQDVIAILLQGFVRRPVALGLNLEGGLRVNDGVSFERDHPDWETIVAMWIEEVQLKHDIIPNPSPASIHTNLEWLFPEQVLPLIERHFLQGGVIDFGPIPLLPMLLDASNQESMPPMISHPLEISQGLIAISAAVYDGLGIVGVVKQLLG